MMMPLTSNEDMRRESPDGRQMEQVAASFIAPNSKLFLLSIAWRFTTGNTGFRVLGALAEDFPALRSVVGARAFEAMCVAYLGEYPSRSFSLRNLGSHLAEWLARNPHFGLVVAHAWPRM